MAVSSSKTLLVASLCSAVLLVVGRLEAGPPEGMPILPPQVEAVLPRETVDQIKAVHVHPSMTPADKQEKIDKIMVNLPVEVLDRIPLPPGFNQLPKDVQDNIKLINRNREKTWAEKQVQLHQYVQSLPAEQRAVLMGPPPTPSTQG